MHEQKEHCKPRVKDTSHNAPRHIFSVECLGSFNIMQPHLAKPARVDQVLACVPAALAHRPFPLIQSHLEALHGRLDCFPFCSP